MTALQSRPAAATSSTPVRPRRRRSSRLLLVAVVLAVLGALGGAYVYTVAVNREGVVAVARTLPVGSQVQLTDLYEVALPADTGLATVAWSQVDTLLGQVAATDLLAGQTLTAESVTGALRPAPGEAVVGLYLAAGQVPSRSLVAGEQVLVVAAGGAGPVRAEVLGSAPIDAAGRVAVDVVVAQSDAVGLALASAEDQVSVVAVSR